MKAVLALCLLLGGACPVQAQAVHPGDLYTAAAADPARAAGLHFPVRGTVNALVIFVQHRDDDYDNALLTDADTEWPSDWSTGPDRRLPQWAGPEPGREGEQLLAPPGTAPEDFAEGSISQFYHLLSNGQFVLTGDVYPRVYRPQHDRLWYIEHRGAFSSGALKLSHEILTSREIQDYVAGRYPGGAGSVFDRYTNGDGRRVAPDGQFDLIILLYRLSSLPQLRENCWPDHPALPACRSRYTSVTNLGGRDGSADAFAAAGAPVHLGGLAVVDHLQSGSGIIVGAYTKKAAARVVAHEIGHRQLYLQHTCPPPGGSPAAATADCVGIMGGPYLTMSAPDRMKLGWVEVEAVDVDTLRGVLRYSLAGAAMGRPGRVLRLQSGSAGCGDVIVEARTWSTFWDRPPDGANDDGDEGDFYLPQEGLYLYKASDGTARCGGPHHLFSSLEHHGLAHRDPVRGFRSGSTYKAAYEPGDAYTPHTRHRFKVHPHPVLDERLSITNITRAGRTFSFSIRSNDPQRDP